MNTPNFTNLVKVLIPNTTLEYEANSAAKNKNKRIQNWLTGLPQAEWVTKGHYYSKNCGQYSRRCTYTKWQYQPRYTSFVIFSPDNANHLVYNYGFLGEENIKNIKAPAGMEFSVDPLGLVVIRKSDKMDYHPTYKDLISKNFVSRVRTAMAINYIKRIQANKLARQQKVYQKIFNKELKNTYVNFIDARRAGNCIFGITEWAKKKLNMEREQLIEAPWLTQVPAKLLLKLDPNNQLVKNSINQAFLRETTISI